MNDLTPAGSSPFDSIRRLRPDGSEYSGKLLHRLPGKVAYPGDEGHIYVIEFDNRTIKVGKTGNPRRRIEGHQSRALPMGRSINRVWLSTSHSNYAANERALIRFGTENSQSMIRAEYFVGLAYAKARHFAKSLTFETLDGAAIEERDKAHRERWSHWLKPADFNEDWVRVPSAYVDAAERWLAPICGISPNPSRPRTLPEQIEQGDPDDLMDTAERLAELRGVDVDEILEMSWLDLIEDLMLNMVRSEVAQIRIFAYENDRMDIVQPGRFFGGEVAS